MRLQIFVVLLLVAVAAGFLLLNPEIASEPRAVQLPGGQVSVPVLGLTILAAVGALLLMLGVGAVAGVAHSHARRRLNVRLAQRDHELALVKGAAYDRVGGTIEALHRDLWTRLDAEGRRRHDELQARLAALEHTIELRFPAESGRDVASTVGESRRPAA
jgi:hypothetical protein